MKYYGDQVTLAKFLKVLRRKSLSQPQRQPNPKKVQRKERSLPRGWWTLEVVILQHSSRLKRVELQVEDSLSLMRDSVRLKRKKRNMKRRPRKKWTKPMRIGQRSSELVANQRTRTKIRAIRPRIKNKEKIMLEARRRRNNMTRTKATTMTSNKISIPITKPREGSNPLILTIRSTKLWIWSFNNKISRNLVLETLKIRARINKTSKDFN